MDLDAYAFIPAQHRLAELGQEQQQVRPGAGRLDETSSPLWLRKLCGVARELTQALEQQQDFVDAVLGQRAIPALAFVDDKSGQDLLGAV